MTRNRFLGMAIGLVVATVVGMVAVGAPASAAPARPVPPYDPGFNTVESPFGIVTTNFDALPGQLGAGPTDMALAPDGSIVLVGNRMEIGGPSPGVVLRYAADGRRDPSFGTDGLLLLPTPVTNVGIDAAGRMVIADVTGVHRLLPNGDPDPSFTLFDPASSTPSIGLVDLSVLPTGEVLIAGNDFGGVALRPLVIMKLDAAGALDPSFDPAGATPGVLRPAGRYGAIAISARADGSFVTANDEAVSGFTASGAVDPTFPAGGAIPYTDIITDVAAGAGGRVAVVGHTSEESRRAVIDVYAPVSGHLVPVTTMRTFVIWDADAVVLADDGSAIVGGALTGPSTLTPAVVRLTPDGALDPRFSGSGLSPGVVSFTTQNIGYTAAVYWVAVDKGGRPVVAGAGTPCRGTCPRFAFATRFLSPTPAAGDGLHPVGPNRILDTRSGLGAPAGRLAPGGQVHVTVAGTNGVPPTGVHAVALNLTATGPDADGYVSAFPVYPCGATGATASNLNYVAQQTVANLVTVPVAADGTICLTSFAATDVVADVVGWYGLADLPGWGGLYGAGFVPVSAVRLMDTRSGLGVPAPGKLAAEHAVGVPAIFTQLPGTAAAVQLTVTVTEPDGAGYVSVYPCAGADANVTVPPAATSTVNFARGETVANTTMASPTPGGDICVQADISATHVVIDLTGWWTYGAGGGFTAVPPHRAADTRNGTGVNPGALQPSGTLRVKVTGGGVAPSESVAVAINLTAARPQAPGYLVAYSCDVVQPPTSNLNYQTDQTVAGYAIVPVAVDGTICIRTYAPTDVVVDVAGWISVP